MSSTIADPAPDFGVRAKTLVERANQALEALLVDAPGEQRLCQAMHYSVFNGGKRLRPLLVYATGQTLGLPLDALDAPACAVELIHCYSLVHDDLPAMDDDDLRRGRPTTHLAFDEALAILAGDALQALAFECLARDPAQVAHPEISLAMIRELTSACGARGMAGGQALDLDMEGQSPEPASVERMFALKTGALIRASVMMAAAARPELPETEVQALRRFADSVGLAFQIRDDLLDIEGQTGVIGKTAGSDEAHDKASWPGRFGVEAARKRIDELSRVAASALSELSGDTSALLWLGRKMVNREY
ncbi:farnesyl diphosphate synthase [Wenzhouxiangella marina]|uniref:Farnesyl-diphosphate synthase n=1 Tax=Wenzhouxiangella marina TaxID=1579979 RepID=A0A0K0XT37_9GAMM|nr:farnesyl diphosphate synthase [Wenzhouxiangella marina]AKS40787.1 Farnesyl-diphosphate synthase [Wenzhouxiangella marina]MBB6087660.1 geranylgeranyl pyrophosphate synthase [Wenzhouxiangella marina]